MEVKKVFIVGGTGFLGYYSALEFLKKGIAVSSASIPDVKLGDWFPKQIDIVSDNLNVFSASAEELTEVFAGHDAIVYAVGPDDRYTPPAPAFEFFFDKLVTQCVKVVKAARAAGVKRAVILNSYFAYFDRQPQYNGQLSNNHAYIKSRVRQAEETIKAGKEGVMDVMILELPYIFGSMPGRMPLWKEVFLDRFDTMPAVFFPKGGTVMVHVRGVAHAVVGATLNGKHGERYPIGLYNMKYKDMIRIMYDAIDNKKKIINSPTWIAYLAGLFLKMKDKREGKEGGLDYAKLMTDIQSRDLFYSQEVIDKTKEDLGYDELGFEDFDVKEGIQSTMQACYPEKFPSSDPANQVKEDLEIINKVWKNK
ncbi:MAG: NAD(P)H-binding protein [Christensenellales bacterium]|jgi:dihydroflavonol-4-reductase